MADRSSHPNEAVLIDPNRVMLPGNPMFGQPIIGGHLQQPGMNVEPASLTAPRVVSEQSTWKRPLMNWRAKKPGIIRGMLFCPNITMQSPNSQTTGNPVVASRIGCIITLVIMLVLMGVLGGVLSLYSVLYSLPPLLLFLAIGHCITCRTFRAIRKLIRQHYNIPGDDCNDCLVATFCERCLLCQIWTELEYRTGKPDLEQVTIVEGDTILIMRK